MSGSRFGVLVTYLGSHRLMSGFLDVIVTSVEEPHIIFQLQSIFDILLKY